MKYTKDLTLIAILTTILVVQELLLSYIPNIQLTVFLFVLYSKKLGILKTAVINFIYVVLDNLLSGSFNFLFIPFMFIGWLMIPILLNTIFKRVETNVTLATLGVLFAFLYSFINIIPGMIMFDLDFITYLKGDIVYELILASSSFITILLLYKPCSKVFDRYIKREISSNLFYLYNMNYSFVIFINCYD